MRRLNRTARRFADDRAGNFAVLSAFSVSMLALAVGLSVNTVQAYQVKMSLRDALDAAVTSTARDLTTGVIKESEARESVERFLFANGDTSFMTSGTFTLDTIVVDRTAKTVDATASARVDVAFPLFRDNNPRVSIESAAIYSDKKVEIAMMLDNTWSMDPKFAHGRDKIGDLRKAARNAVTLALAQNRDPSHPRVRVALVPYADAVNIGDLAEQASFVEVAGGPNIPPSDGSQARAVAVSASASRPDNCTTERKLRDGKADFSDDGPATRRPDGTGKTYPAKVNRDDRLKRENLPYCPEGVLLPLTADSDKLLDSIDGYKAVGVTAGAIGIQWAYYMLSPNWRNAIQDASLGTGPAVYDADKTTKVAILMTDGVFNTAFAGVPNGGERDSNTSKSKSAAYAISLCDNMKKDGIQVFTIGFDLDSVDKDDHADPKEAKKLLRDCASPDTATMKHYFEASTGEDLDAAFKAIIRNTERLALTK